LLTDGTTTLDAVEAALKAQDIEFSRRDAANQEWCFTETSLIVALRPEQRGFAIIDAVSRPWPDDMGNPQTDPMVFAAWSMGHFGPYTFPSGLARAVEQAWCWTAARDVVTAHGGFVRIRLSYAFGAADSDLVLPEGYDPVAELRFLSRAVLPLLDVSGVLCYFNPNGEVLRDACGFRELWSACNEQNNLPLPIWMNIRLYRPNEKLLLMDTVGNSQLDIQDVEAVFPGASYGPQEVDYYLRNLTHYLLDLGRALETGESIDGPGEADLSWVTEALDLGVLAPPRRVVRVFPKTERGRIRKTLSKF
jgi:hypothetical protein